MPFSRPLATVPASPPDPRGETGFAVGQREVLELLHRFGSAITAELDPTRVLAALTDEAPRLVGAQMAAFVRKLDDGGAVVERTFGTTPLNAAPDLSGVVEIWRGLGVFRVGEVRDAACRELLPGARSLLAVPIVLRSGRVLGGLFLGHIQADAFHQRDEWLALGVASWAGVAYDNARLYEDTRKAEQGKEFLAQASVLLSESLDYETTLRSVVRLAVPRLADWSAIDLADDEGRLSRLEVFHSDPSRSELIRELDRRFPPDVRHALTVPAVMASGRSAFCADVTERMLLDVARSPEHLELLRAIEVRSLAIVPLVARGRSLGTLTLATSGGRRFGAEDLGLAEDVACRAALAVDNARLHREVQRAAGRSRFIAEASRVLSSSLDYDATLETLARLAVPDFADWCIVDMLDDAGEVEAVAVAHAQPDMEAVVRDMRRRYPLPRNRQSPAARVIRSERPMLVPDLDEALFDSAADEEHRVLLRRLEGRSLIAVPLMARGQTLGAITYVSTRPGGYGASELAFAEKLALRAALAIDNARLFHRERNAQEELKSKLNFERDIMQRLAASFLGRAIPFDSVEMASEYVPAYTAERIGGDYYDFIPMGPRRMAVVIGDVCGKGLHAGAYTAMVKYHLRAYALEEPEPEKVFKRLNQSLHSGMSHEDMFVTLVYAVLDTEAGTVTYANAGHPAPVLYDAQTRTSTRLPVTGGLMGALPTMSFRQATVALPRGALLALFTDGITEAAGVLDPDGDGGIAALLGSDPDAPVQVLADRVVEHALVRARGVFRDDVALVLVRRTS